MRRRLMWMGLCLVGTVSCSQGELGPNISNVDGTAIVSVRIQPSVDTILIPDTVRASDRLQLRGVATGRTGGDITVDRFVWRSSDPTVARVDSFGLVTPVRTGSVEITASAYKVGTARVVVLPASNRIVVTPRADTIFIDEPVTATTDSARLRAQAYDGAGVAVTGVRYSWQSSAPATASVDSTGLARALSFGLTTLTVRGNGAQATVSLLVRPRTERIAIAPGVDTIFVDDPIVAAKDTARPAPLAFDIAGRPLLSGVRFSWQSAAPTVATVDSAGVVRARALGTTTLTLRAALSEATATMNVLPVVRNVTLSSPLAQVLDGDTLQLTARAFDYLSQPMARRFVWRSSSPGVATVDSMGRVIFVSPGTATFTATSAFRSSAVAVTALPRQLLMVDAGGDFACGITPLGRGYCWGRGDIGQLGSVADSTCFNDDGVRLPCTLEPKHMEGGVEFGIIAAGDRAVCGVSAQRLLYCWGDDAFGQIGNGGAGGGPVPALATVGSERFTTVTAGGAHACALNLLGAAYCWGKDESGQLGDILDVNSTTPIPVVGPTGRPSDALRFTKISAGASHTCAVTVDGAAFCWGEGQFGALGNGQSTSRDFPVAVAGTEPFREVSAGRDHSCAVAASGNLYCWGSNDSAQVGQPAAVRLKDVPTIVGSGYTAVSAGDYFTCALTTAKTVNCWGRNSLGELGRGEPNPRGTHGTPAGVVPVVPFVSVSVGRRHACALGTDGQTYCWGSNMLGALGNQLQAAVRTTPQKVARPR